MQYPVARGCRPVKYTAAMMMTPYAVSSRCQNQRGIVSCRDVVRGLSRVGDRALQNAAWATQRVMRHAFIPIPKTVRVNPTLLKCARKRLVVNGVQDAGVPVL